MSNEKKIVNISVRNLRATGDGTVIVCDNSDYVLHFDFDSEWDDKKAKTARINYNGTKCIDLPLLGNKVEIERTPVAWQLQIGAYADNIKTTTPAIFNCDFSILSSNPIHEEIPEDTYNKIMALINAIDDAIIDVSVLPLEDINTNALYRRGGSIFHYYNGAWMGIGSGGGSGGSGADGITPMLKINKDNYWCVSYDNGKNWVSLNVKATGADGKDGVDGKDGADGLTPYIKYGYWWIGDTNTHVKAEAVDGADGKDGVDGITPEFKVENGELKVSYDNGATWSTLGYIKGADGKDGKDGINGTDGKDGIDGEDGKDGVDGITPMLKIGEDDYWYVSYDNGATWTSLGVKATGDALKMSDIDDELSQDLPEGRVYNAELHDILKSKYRLYAEKSVADGGGVSPQCYISANSATDRLFSPVGYTDFEEMCDNNDLAPDKAVEDTADQQGHYVTRVVNGVTEYYPRLTSIVKRTIDDNVRTNKPVDSTDAVPYGYFKKYTFENANVKDYQVVRRGSTGQLYSTVVSDTATTKHTFVLRDSEGCVRGETKNNNTDKTAIEGTTLVNVTYLNSELSSIEAIAKGRATGYVFDTVADLDTWLANSENTQKLVLGDNFYIKALAEPDYWWDGTQKQMLETQKVDLSEYATKDDIPTTLPASDVYDWAKAATKPEYKYSEIKETPTLGSLASKSSVSKTDLDSSVQTSLGKADSALQSYTETDPTVPAWAKAANPPTYTAQEVGAVPTTRKINNKELSGDINLSASDVGALPSTTVIPTLEGYATEDYVDEAVKNVEVDASSLTISGIVAEGIGGIPPHTTYENAPVIDVLKALLFKYKAFVFNTISTLESGGTFEYGTRKVITTVTPTFTTYSKPINSVKIGTTSGGNNLYEGTSAISGAAITLPTPHTFDGTADGQIYCTLSDGVGNDSTTKTVSVSFKFIKKDYVAFTATLSAPTSASSSSASPITGKSVEISPSNSHVWFMMLSPDSDYRIWQKNFSGGLSKYLDTEFSETEFTTSTNAVLTYYAYGTKEAQSANNATFELRTTDPNTYPNYVMVTATTDTPTDVSSATSIGVGGTESETTASNAYVWFFAKSSGNYTIWRKDGNWWVIVPTTSSNGTVSAKTIANTNIDYYTYRTSNAVSVTNVNLALKTSDPNSYPNYYAVTDSINIPAISSASGIGVGGNEQEDIITQDDNYIWFLMLGTYEKRIIQQWKSGSWNNMTTTYAGTVDFTTTGVTKTYHAYRTDSLFADTANYRIIEGEN